MKTFRYIYIMLLSCLTFSACQEIEDPANNPPIVTTDDSVKYSDSFASLSGSISTKSKAYFLISTSLDLQNARKCEARNYELKYYADVKELTSGTTYYYTLCATDGRCEVRGEVKSFTTSAYLTINSVNTTSWISTTTSLTEPFSTGNIIGTYVVKDNNEVYSDCGNMKTLYEFNSWRFPYYTSVSAFSGKVYAYYPYSDKNERDNPHSVLVHANGYCDFQYGCSETVDAKHASADILMKHALAKVTFAVTKDCDANITSMLANLRNEGNSNALSVMGVMDIITGEIKSSVIEGGDGLFQEKECVLDKVNPQYIDFFVIPTSFKEKQVVFSLFIEGKNVSVPMSASKWEAGKQYTIPVVVFQENQSAQVGDYYYDDGTWSTKRQSSKHCIGIVFALSETKGDDINPFLKSSMHGRIVALNDVGSFIWGEIEDCKWIPNFELLDGKSNDGYLPIDGMKKYAFTHSNLPYNLSNWPTKTGVDFSLTSYNGNYYTHGLNVCKNSAAEACYAYQYKEKGAQWYLPALGELTRLGMVYGAELVSRSVIKLSSGAYWSSSEHNSSSAWYYDFFKGWVGRADKPVINSVRPIACF